jgi:hypothetical protein
MGSGRQRDLDRPDLEHDTEKAAAFSDKITRPNKCLRSEITIRSEAVFARKTGGRRKIHFSAIQAATIPDFAGIIAPWRSP